jgi:alpha-1,2-mannosyltransferase
LQFVKDGFTGILPQHFAPQDGTSAEPLQPFNDLNREETSRYVELGQCDYLVVLLDRNQPVQENVLRANLLHSEETRESLPATASFRAVISEPVISPNFSPHSLYRAYYVPFKTPESVKFKDYILYKRYSEEL